MSNELARTSAPASSRDTASASASPTPTPITHDRSDWANTSPTILDAAAPRAMRIPNSLRRCPTRYDTTPYTPLIVNSNAMQPVAVASQYAAWNGYICRSSEVASECASSTADESLPETFDTMDTRRPVASPRVRASSVACRASVGAG